MIKTLAAITQFIATFSFIDAPIDALIVTWNLKWSTIKVMLIRPALRFSPEVFSVWLCVAYQPRSVLRFIMYGQHFASPRFSELLPIFQLLTISVDQCTIECKVSSIVCSFIYCCRGKKMLDPSPFSLPKISPPPTHTHTKPCL